MNLASRADESPARATILAFIRRAFPADGPQAYATSELAALNRRRSSRLPFDPYERVRTGLYCAYEPGAGDAVRWVVQS